MVKSKHFEANAILIYYISIYGFLSQFLPTSSAELKQSQHLGYKEIPNKIYHASGIDVRYKNNDANPKWEPFRDIHHRNENTKKKEEDEENQKWDPFGSSKHLEQQNSILSTSPYSRRRKTANPSSSLGTLEVSSIARLEQLLVKMRLWESALVNHFRGRTYPVNHPMWAKLKSFYTSEVEDNYENDENKNFKLSKSTFLEQSRPWPFGFFRKRRNVLSISESSTILELEQMLVRMRLWESALVNHFQSRNPENLASNPLWVKLLKVRNVIRTITIRLLQLRELDANRMKR